jgi:phosphate uptake regulator
MVMFMSVVRKVQRTPSGTFFICMPKSWAERYGLKRGSVVSLSETSDGGLLVDPKFGAEPSLRTITLKPGPILSREITGKYLLGFDIIRVETKERISFEVRESVKETVSRLIGLEIVEEDYSSIVLQCLLEPSGFPPEKILRRGYAIAAGMHRDVINALVDGDLHLARSVIARDEEVNRLYFLSVRILRTIIQNPSLNEKLGVQPIECLDYRLVASLVEAIGDECVRTALKTIELKGAKLTEDLKKLFVDFHTSCFEAHENALKAFFVGDVTLAESVRGIREKIEKASTNIEKVTREQSLDFMPQILAVASFLRQIYEHSVDIADLVVPRKL